MTTSARSSLFCWRALRCRHHRMALAAISITREISSHTNVSLPDDRRSSSLLLIPAGAAPVANGYLLSSRGFQCPTKINCSTQSDGWPAHSAPLPGDRGDMLRHRAGGDRWLGGHGRAADAGARPGRASVSGRVGGHHLSAGAGDDVAAVLRARHPHRAAAALSVRPAGFPAVDRAVFLRPEPAAAVAGALLAGAGRGGRAQRVERADPLDLSGAPARARPGDRQRRGVEFDRDRPDAGRTGAVGGELAVDLRRRGAIGAAVAAARAPARCRNRSRATIPTMCAPRCCARSPSA